MNAQEIRTKMLNSYMSNDKEGLNSIHVDLLNQRAKLNRWFTRFLDLYDEKLAKADRDDPHKRLYETKFAQYSELNTLVRAAEHYLTRT